MLQKNRVIYLKANIVELEDERETQAFFLR